MLQPMTFEQRRTLTAILASVEALWCPWRYHMVPNPVPKAGAVCDRRVAFPSKGIPFVVSGEGAERVSGERDLQSLESAGYIRSHHKGKRVGVSLTPHGDDIARALAGCWTVRRQFHWLGELVPDAGDHVNQGYINECSILDKTYATVVSKDLVGLEIELLPLLCAGLVESDGDIQGRTGYRVTDAGRGAEIPPEREVPDFDEELAEHYDEIFKRELAGRNRWPTKPGQLGIPLGCGDWS